MGCDGEHSFQINFLESIQALMKHAAVALKDFKPTKQDLEEAMDCEQCTEPSNNAPNETTG